MLTRILIFGIFLFKQFDGFSQSINVGGVFPTVDHSGKLSDKWGYSLYYFGAFPLFNFDKPNVSKDSYFHLFHAEQALSYSPTSRFSLTGSYVYERAHVLYDIYTSENRFYLQGKYKHSVGKVNITHRLRFDGRFIHNRITNETPFTHRLRHQLGFEVPLDGKSYFTGYEEAFFNTYSNAGKVYGENWAFAACGRKLSERNKIELGILYVTWNI